MNRPNAFLVTIAIALSGFLFCSSASAVQVFSFDLTFSEGPLAGIGGSMATITTTDGDTPGAFATWKNISNGTVTDFSAMIVIDAMGNTLDFDLSKVATGFVKVVGGEVTAGTFSATLTPTPLTGLSLQFNTSTVIVNGTPAGGFSKGVGGITPKAPAPPPPPPPPPGVAVPEAGSTLPLFAAVVVLFGFIKRRQQRA